MKTMKRICAISPWAASGAAFAQADELPLQNGGYVAPMLSYAKADAGWQTDDGYGGGLALGYRAQRWAFEFDAAYARYGADVGGSDTKLLTLGFNGLAFPLPALSALYVIAGGGYLNGEERVDTVTSQSSLGSGMIVVFTDTTSEDFSAYYLQAGFGALFPLRAGRHDLAIRTEALLRHTETRHEGFDDALVRLGLQFPFGKRATAPRPQPVTVVPVSGS